MIIVWYQVACFRNWFQVEKWAFRSVYIIFYKATEVTVLLPTYRSSGTHSTEQHIFSDTLQVNMHQMRLLNILWYIKGKNVSDSSTLCFFHFSGFCHCRILHGKALLVTGNDLRVRNSSIIVHRHAGGYGAAPCRCNPFFIATII